MMKAASDVLIRTRQEMYDAVKELTQEQWFAQPESFANNIAWNVGHVIIAQQGLIYRRAGVAGYVTREMTGMYLPGTSPADWTTQPDTNQLLELLIDLPQKMADDVAAGKFDNIELPETDPFGLPPAASMEHAMIGNNYHEGIHMGAILALLDFVK